MQKINDIQRCSGGFAHVLCMKFEDKSHSKIQLRQVYFMCQNRNIPLH